MNIIIGFGKTGESCARYWRAQQIDFVMIDSREYDPSLIQQADEIVISPGVPPDSFPPEKTISDIALFARHAQAPIIAITGTNAKGTVTTLVGDMIQQAGLTAAVGGNIGTPALDLLAQPVPDFYVLEISSFQLETTHNLQAKAAALLNISPDHLDRHQTMENYHKAKQRIYHHCESAIFNRDDNATFPAYPVSHKISFGLNTPAENQWGITQNHLACGKNLLLPISALKIQGRHNWTNALAALALGQAIGLPAAAMIETLAAFPGLPHRCEWVAAQNHIQWINDSKGTNVGATLAALEGLGSSHPAGKIILIAGGLGKNADFTLLQDVVRRYTRHVILIGRDAGLIAQAISAHTDITFAASLAEAVQLAHTLALSGDIVLLSPACASLDMFKDFEARGNQFKQLVKDLCQA